MNGKELFIFAIIFVIVLGLLINGEKQCDGDYVRGLFWYECIER